MEEPPQPIKAYCTVDPHNLTKVGDEYYCQRCSKTLVNAEQGCSVNRARFTRASNLICGFVSALALAGCVTNDGDIPLPGIYYSPDEIDTNSGEYPTAKRVDGEVGVVESPYGGHLVEVSRLPEGSLVIDPNFPVEAKKLFRI